MKTMESKFVPYEEALKLKELGFDEECFGYFLLNGNNKVIPLNIKYCDLECFSAPLWQDAFDWFREKHIWNGEIYTIDMGAIEYSFQIRNLYSEKYCYDNFIGAGNSYSGTFNTYQEAQLECLRKMIEIVEQQKEKS